MPADTQWAVTRLQPTLVQHFNTLIKDDKLAHAYLFSGTQESGTTALAQWVALRLFCSNIQNDQPCGQCPHCRQVLSGNHPDFLKIVPTGATIKVDDIRYLRQEMTRTGVEQSRRIFEIDQADLLTPGAANSLLKFIEEPPGPVLIILVSEQKQRLLPTILSRVQVIDFPPVSAAQVADKLTEEGLSPELAPLFSALGTSVTTARELATDKNLTPLIETAWQWLTAVGRGDWQAFILVQTRIMPLVKDRPTQNLFLDILITALQDILMAQYAPALPGHFPQQRTQCTAVAQALPPAVMTAVVSDALAAQRRLQGNVGFQGLLERLTAQILSSLT